MPKEPGGTIERPQQEGLEPTRTRQEVEKTLGITPYLLRQYISDLLAEGAEGYTQEGKTGRITPALFEQIRARVDARPEEAPADAYAMNRLQAALECDYTTLQEAVEQCPPNKRDQYGVMRAGNGIATQHYKPSYLGKLRIFLAGEAVDEAFFNKKELVTELYDQRYLSKQAAAEYLNITVAKLGQVMEKTPPYQDEINNDGKRPTYAVRYLLRLRLYIDHQIEFQKPITPLERRRTELLNLVQRLEFRLQLDPVLFQDVQKDYLWGKEFMKQVGKTLQSVEDVRQYITTSHHIDDLTIEEFKNNLQTLQDEVQKTTVEIIEKMAVVLSDNDEFEEGPVVEHTITLTPELRDHYQKIMASTSDALQIVFTPLQNIPTGLPELRYAVRQLMEQYSVMSGQISQDVSLPENILARLDDALNLAEEYIERYHTLVSAA